MRFKNFLRLCKQADISTQAASASFFLLLSGLPLTVLLLSLLSFLPVSPEDLLAWAKPFVPSVLYGAFRSMLEALPTDSVPLLSFGTLTLIWASSKGVYGVLQGLNRICSVRETRSAVKRRLICLLFTLLMLLSLAATLLVHVLSHSLLERILDPGSLFHNILLALANNAHLTCIILLSVYFTAVYLVLPNRKTTVRQVLPGAVCTAAAWDLFSYAFSFYASYIGSYSRLYGSIGTLLLTMLWVYLCLSLLFYGALFNESKDLPA